MKIVKTDAAGFIDFCLTRYFSDFQSSSVAIDNLHDYFKLPFISVPLPRLMFRSNFHSPQTGVARDYRSDGGYSFGIFC
ncbi:hypothetical protein [Geopsychrobacter electrodiphilus]|uniref:hypothetical protein n=1 Tax=Geopsychrobacter electrodiphilus TaxID=225196 RepID=UPI00039B1F4B|nr:hypothetical protein [Geopsychrobacter electrodiphilus]